MKVRKKPVLVDAVLWDGKFDGDVTEFSLFIVVEDRNRVCEKCGQHIVEHGSIPTLEGRHTMCPGDWIITGVAGEKYPCKPDIFERTYEKLE